MLLPGVAGIELQPIPAGGLRGCLGTYSEKFCAGAGSGCLNTTQRLELNHPTLVKTTFSKACAHAGDVERAELLEADSWGQCLRLGVN